MRVVDKYIISDFIATFVMTLLIFTFVMCVGTVIRAIDLLVRGVSGLFILQVFLYNIPFLMTFSIPMSVLTTVLLQFGRMSFDGEITAMKASGMTMWQIVAPVIMISIVASLVCVYLCYEVAPKSHFKQRQVLVNVGMEEPINLLEEGRFVKDFPGLMIYIAKKDRKQVQDVVVYEMGADGVVRNVRAKRGELKADQEQKALLIDLYDVRIDQPDKDNPLDPTKARYVSAEHYPVRLDFSEMLKRGKIEKKVSDMTFAELVYAIRNVRAAFPDLREDDLKRQHMRMLVEANERLALSMSCFAFALFGIPLGMRSRRKESSVGVGISLLLVFFFYFFIIIADSMVGHPELRPDLIAWIPVVLGEVFGCYFIWRSN